jgi:hypothetical protein
LNEEEAGGGRDQGASEARHKSSVAKENEEADGFRDKEEEHGSVEGRPVVHAFLFCSRFQRRQLEGRQIGGNAEHQRHLHQNVDTLKDIVLPAAETRGFEGRVQLTVPETLMSALVSCHRLKGRKNCKAMSWHAKTARQQHTRRKNTAKCFPSACSATSSAI